MKVEIWSDFICPFCYIGKRRFENALKQFGHHDEVEVVYRSFELDPHAPRDVDHDVYDMVAQKYSMSREKSQGMHDDLTQQAQAVGLTYRFDTAILTNTFDAHRLTHFAAKHGKGAEMTERLLKAYFTDSKHIGDPTVLASLAGELGLDSQAVSDMLAGDAYTQEVRADEQAASDFGARGVPFFVIDRKYGVSGAQSPEVFLQALQQAWDEAHPKLTFVNEAGSTDTDSACADGVCNPAAAEKK